LDDIETTLNGNFTLSYGFAPVCVAPVRYTLKLLGLYPLKNFQRNPIHRDHGTSTLQTDGRTDRQLNSTQLN